MEDYIEDCLELNQQINILEHEERAFGDCDNTLTVWEDWDASFSTE